MKLKEYAETIKKIAKDYPNVEVIYSIDDEGNAFKKVQFAPCLGNYNEDDDFDSDRLKGEIENAVCIN